jgi:hypothetical protein
VSAQPSLPTTSAAEPDASPAFEWVDLMSLQASRLLGIPGWTAKRFESIEPDSVLLTGGVYTETFKTGPRKGRTNYSKPVSGTARIFVLSRASMRAFDREWEAETGKCVRCQGGGRRVTGWSAVDGTTYRECTDCKGSGKPAVRT